MKRKLIDLANMRAQQLAAAETALAAGNQTDYNAAMDAVTQLNAEIQQVQTLLDEQARSMVPEGTPNPDPVRNVDELAADLREGRRIQLDVPTMRDSFRSPVNSILTSTGTLATPTGVGTNIRGENRVSAILDRVYVADLSGCAEWLEPYVKTPSTADAGTEGSAPTTSEPTFRTAAIKPKLVDTVAYVSRYIEALTPANYLAKVQSLALAALRKKVVEFLTKGDGSTFYGMTNAKNTDNEDIYDTLTVGAATIDAGTLRKIVLGSGGDEETGGGILMLHKDDLIAFGDVRGTNEKQAVYAIEPDAETNGNTGVIRDGGLSVSYVINNQLTALSKSTKTSTAIKTMVYGDPQNYELGLFSPYSVEVDRSYKFAEGLLTIRGSVMAGGNLIAHEGMTVVTLAATGS